VRLVTTWHSSRRRRGGPQTRDHFRDLDALAGAGVDELQKANDVGPVMAQSIFDFFRNPRNAAVIDKLKKAGVRTRDAAVPKVAATGPFAGKTVVITGTLKKFSRDEAREACRTRGAIPTDSVSKKTNYLVVGADPVPNSTKQETRRPWSSTKRRF